MKECKNIDEVRENIDLLDHQIVRLISARSKYVEQAARFKQTTEGVKAPNRVEIVIEKVRKLADENDLNPDIVEKTYRTLISCFIDQELKDFEKARRYEGNE